MKHIAVSDRQQQTVVMMQVENEIGMLERQYWKFTYLLPATKVVLSK